MLGLFKRFPFFIQVVMVFAIAMMFPAMIAWQYRMLVVMQAFLFTGLLTIIVSILLGILMLDRDRGYDYRSQLINMILVYLLLPPILALPIVQITDRFDFWRASFEMLSSLTTTGASLIETSVGLMYPIMVYSALVAWIGAFFLLLVVYAIMEPLQIGGFELISEMEPGAGSRYTGGSTGSSDRVFRYVILLAPPYILATALLAFLLALSGERFMFAVIHAWSIMSSSGISPYAHLGETDMHLFGEMVMFVFLAFGLSRHFLLDLSRGRLPRFRRNDPELRVVGVLLLISVTIFTYFFFLQEVETRHLPNIENFILSIWGMLFTVVSFITTHGYISEYWQFEVNNIEIHTSSIYLLGLAMLGGGVATTAGGVKLLRIYALSRLTERELGRMIDPESIAASGMAGRHLRRRGGLNALVFLMLFMAGISSAALLLTAMGLEFEEAIMMAIAATTNCGPIIDLLPNHHVDLSSVSDGILMVMGVAMIFGRVEVFVLISILNPSFWSERGAKLL